MLTLWFCSSLLGQAKLESIVKAESEQYLKNDGTIGLSIGVIIENKSHTFNYGVQNMTGPTPPTEHSIYSIGSISKTFIAALLAKAVLDKKLNLEDDIRRYLPDAQRFVNLEVNGNPVRLIHLANHTAGIPSQLTTLPSDWKTFTADEKYRFKKSYGKEDFLYDLSKIKLETIPGSQYQYSNAGYKLLSIILENIYQLPYEKLMEKYVSTAFKMPYTKVYLTKDEWNLFANGKQDLKVLTETKNIDDYTSGPVLNSTVEDMLKYLSYQIHERKKAITMTHKTTFRNDAGVEIGLAWRKDKTDDGIPYFYHLGSGWGCNSIMIFSPEKKSGIIVMANETADQGKLAAMAENIFVKSLKIDR